MDAHDGYNFFKKAVPYQPQATLVPRLLPTHLPFGRNFAVYFQGSTSQNKTYRVELLDKDGKFVAQVGQGTNSPVTINIQNVSPLDVYRLRIVSEAPFCKVHFPIRLLCQVAGLL
jgi:hypothetical protein